MAQRRQRIEELEGQDLQAQLLGDEEVKPIEFDGTKSYQFYKTNEED